MDGSWNICTCTPIPFRFSKGVWCCKNKSHLFFPGRIRSLLKYDRIRLISGAARVQFLSFYDLNTKTVSADELYHVDFLRSLNCFTIQRVKWVLLVEVIYQTPSGFNKPSISCLFRNLSNANQFLLLWKISKRQLLQNTIKLHVISSITPFNLNLQPIKTTISILRLIFHD